MSMLPPVFQTLLASPAVTAIVGSGLGARIYRHSSAPQDTTQPYITWFLVSGAPENTLSELPSIDRMSIQVDCWSLSDQGIEDMATAVRDAIEPYAHMLSVPVDSQEPDTKLYRISLQFDWWQSRPGP